MAVAWARVAVATVFDSLSRGLTLLLLSLSSLLSPPLLVVEGVCFLEKLPRPLVVPLLFASRRLPRGGGVRSPPVPSCHSSPLPCDCVVFCSECVAVSVCAAVCACTTCKKGMQPC